MYRVALVFVTSPVSEMEGPDPVHSGARAFVHALRDSGLVEGRNLLLERRSLGGKPERASQVVTELLHLKVDVIVSSSNLVTRSAKEATTSTPIVMVANVTPVEDGLVASLARPGGNVTGLSFDVGPDLDVKRLELLREAVPHITRVAFIGSRSVWDNPAGKEVQVAARTLGLTLFHAESMPNDYAQAFATVIRERANAIFTATSPSNYAQRRLIIEFAAKNRVPASYAFRESVEAGGLMAYGVNSADLYRRAAGYVDRILKGARPADLPVEQPTKFELVINRASRES